jgi:hypothetical protein
VTTNVLTLNGGTEKCKKALFSSDEIPGTTFNTLTLHPEYSECTAFGLAATVSTEGCNYVLSTSSATAGSMAIECANGKEVLTTVKAAGCTVKIGAQTPSSPGVD